MNSNLNKNDLIEILSDNSINKELFTYADKIRKENVGDKIHLRGLIEISNICANNCHYCGLRRDNKFVERYKMSPENILTCVKTAVDSGYKTIVLQSGESPCYKIEELSNLIKTIKNHDIAVTLSLGEKTFEEYKILKDSGADRFLIRIETTDPILYKKMHPNMNFENRITCLKNLKKLGYEVGTGCLVGLPEQSIDSLANDILFFKEINADMIGIGPFIPCPNTPLADTPLKNNFELSLKVMALTRIILPKINIPATTAMETINKNGKFIALQSGANVLMLNINEFEFKKNYQIYPDKVLNNNSVQNERINIINDLKNINRTISLNQGNSLTKKDA